MVDRGVSRVLLIFKRSSICNGAGLAALKLFGFCFSMFWWIALSSLVSSFPSLDSSGCLLLVGSTSSRKSLKTLPAH